MSDKSIEKAFLYFLILSFVLHVAALTCFIIILKQQKKREAGQEAYMVELSDVPPTKEVPKKQDQTVPYKGATHPTARQNAQKENRTQHADAVKPLERIPGKPVPLRVPTIGRGPLPGGSTIQPPKGKTLPELSKLYPSSNQMKGLENRYRKELGVSVGGGFSAALDTDDMMLASFLTRFERAVNEHMPHYSVEQSRQIIMETQGKRHWSVIVVFNRSGEVEELRAKSTGSKLMDDALQRAVNAVGPLGSLPKSYEGDHLRVPFVYVLN